MAYQQALDGSNGSIASRRTAGVAGHGKLGRVLGLAAEMGSHGNFLATVLVSVTHQS